MAVVNVEIESIKNTRYAIQKLHEVANKCMSESQEAFASVESQITNIYQNAHARVVNLQSKMAQNRRYAEQIRDEYEKQARDVREGRSNVMLAYGPDHYLKEAAEMQKQIDEIQEALKILSNQIKTYNESKRIYLSLLGKIASGSGSGDSGDIERVLEKTISALDSYVHTSFSSDSCSAYDAFSAQMQAVQNAANSRRLQDAAREHELIREFGEDE